MRKKTLLDLFAGYVLPSDAYRIGILAMRTQIIKLCCELELLRGPDAKAVHAGVVVMVVEEGMVW